MERDRRPRRPVAGRRRVEIDRRSRRSRPGRTRPGPTRGHRGRVVSTPAIVASAPSARPRASAIDDRRAGQASAWASASASASGWASASGVGTSASVSGVGVGVGVGVAVGVGVGIGVGVGGRRRSRRRCRRRVGVGVGVGVGRRRRGRTRRWHRRRRETLRRRRRLHEPVGSVVVRVACHCRVRRPARAPGSIRPAAPARRVPSTNPFVASPHPIASIGAPPTTRSATAPPVAANPPVYVSVRHGAVDARPRWRSGSAGPGSRIVAAVHVALRVTVEPLDVA